MRSKKFLWASFVSVILLFVILLFNFLDLDLARTEAQIKAPSAFLPFGGPILKVVRCTCSAGHVVFVGPPGSPAKTKGLLNRFHFVPTQTILFKFFQTTRIGAWLLGTYFPGTGNKCLIASHDDCYVFPNDGIINLLGTSL